MTQDERTGWLPLTLVLCASWLVITVALIASIAALDVTLPRFIARPAPFLVGGFIAGRFVGAAERRPKLIAAAVVAVVSTAAWTSFAFATHTVSVSPDRAFLVIALAAGLNVLEGLWAYFGMFLGNLRRERPSAGRTELEAELDDLEQELRKEAVRDRTDRRA